MSASNWDCCPRCRAKAIADQEKLQKKADAAYGKVSAQKYMEMRDMASVPVSENQTLREDYQLGFTLAGVFYVTYRCSCQKCDFGHVFKHEQQQNMAKETP